MKTLKERKFKNSQFYVHFGKSQAIPGQAMDIAELLERSSRGQRLNISSRPLNPFVSQDDDGNSSADETFDNTPEIISDIVDLQNAADALKAQKTNLLKRIASAKKQKTETPREDVSDV